MKATFEFLADDVYIDRFNLVKSIDNTFVKTEIQTDLKFTGVDHEYLFNERLKSSDKEIGTLTHECEDNTFEKDVFISHNEGTFDLKRCITTKKLNFANPLDCLIGNNRINIFDYPSGTTKSVQGVLIQGTHFNSKYIQLPNDYTFDFILSELGGIPDRTSIGYSIEYVRVLAEAKSIIIEDAGGNTEYYDGHDCSIYVRYVSSYAEVQLSPDWVYLEGGWWLNPDLYPKYTFKPVTVTVQRIGTFEPKDYITKLWEAGAILNYQELPISNTINLNEVLIGLFECTGLTLISNFLGINPDGSEPSNKYYDFSESYCKFIKIVQSYDIIRESAIEDSFGKSGFLTSKEILTDLSLLFNMTMVTDTTLNIARWEHVSYFQTKGYDLTLRTDIDISPLESDKDQLDSELFLMAQPTSDEFYKVKIKYNTPDLYKEENEQKYQVKKFLTDVFTTLNNTKFQASEYEPLFFLLSTDGESIVSLNNQFSINSIFRNLHDLNRPYKTGQIGINFTEFSGFSIGLEATIKFFSSVLTWDALFPFMSVKTKLGTFKVDSVEINEKGLITLKVKK